MACAAGTGVRNARRSRAARAAALRGHWAEQNSSCTAIRHWWPTVFWFPLTFPKPGMYRVLGDFYPLGGLPQLSSETVIVPGEPPAPVTLGRDYSPKDGPNLHVSLETVPDRPVATTRTQLRFVVNSEKPLEKYLGAW